MPCQAMPLIQENPKTASYHSQGPGVAVAALTDLGLLLGR